MPTPVRKSGLYPPCRKWLVISRLAIGLHGGWLQGRISLAKLTHFFHFHKPHPKNFPKNYTPHQKFLPEALAGARGVFYHEETKITKGRRMKSIFFVPSSLRGFKSLSRRRWCAGRFLPRRNEGDEGLAHEVYFLRSFVVLKVYAAGAGARGVFYHEETKGTKSWRA